MTRSRNGGTGQRIVVVSGLSTVGNLGDDGDFVTLLSRWRTETAHRDADKGRGRSSTWIGGGSTIEADELAAPFEHHSTDFDVNDHVGENDDPDGAIKGRDSEDIPLWAYPAPKLVELEKILGMGEVGLTLAEP